MVMRLDVDFARPLGKQDKLRLLLAVATLAKSRRVRFVRGDHAAVVMGEGLSERRLREVLSEHGFTPEAVRTSLDPDEDARADDPPEEPGQKEKVRAIGR
jgi:uroporphyrinogen-III synthase